MAQIFVVFIKQVVITQGANKRRTVLALLPVVCLQGKKVHFPHYTVFAFAAPLLSVLDCLCVPLSLSADYHVFHLD